MSHSDIDLRACEEDMATLAYEIDQLRAELAAAREEIALQVIERDELKFVIQKRNEELAALRQQAEEPVAWMLPDSYGGNFITHKRKQQDLYRNDALFTVPLYLAPPAAAPASDEKEVFRKVLARLRNCISDYGGHGNPGCPDRVEAYLAMATADALLASALPAAGPTWQPISTAPKDGSEFLMRFVGRRPYITGVKWHQGCFVQLSDYSPVESRTATHWMPLPAAPETEK